MQIKAPRGTYDILPDDAVKWQFAEKTIRRTAERFGYREVRTPVFEHTELFERGVGVTTDIVSKEMYTFKDRSQRSLTLRPEGTAPCVRAFIEHSLYGGVLPVKWYYLGPMFRYDRPQTGRYRQFQQFGVEVFGSDNPFLDAEVILLLINILSELGLTDYEVHLNSVGCPQCRDAYRHKLIEHIRPVREKLCDDCRVRFEQNPLRVLDCKNETCHLAITGYPVLMDHLCSECREHYEIVQAALRENRVTYIHDDNLVRGLDYYTNTAFEVHIPGIGAQSAVGGGGRYNGLVQECGGPDLPGIGFALGMERLLTALDSREGENTLSRGIPVFVAVMSAELEGTGLKLLQELRQAGIECDKDYNQRSPRAQLKYADKLGARLVVLLGEEEAQKGMLSIRDMQSGEQISITATEAVSFIQKKLAESGEENAG